MIQCQQDTSLENDNKNLISEVDLIVIAVVFCRKKAEAKICFMKLYSFSLWW